MNSITRQLRLINLNFPLYPNVKFTRNIHLLRSATEISSISVNKRNDCNDNLFKSLQCNKLNSNAYLPVRFKSKQKHPKKSKSTDDYSSDEDDDDMAEFREGNKSDKSLAQIKVQSMRLDALIKSGLGISRNKAEKMFYESKIRLNGKKVNKKSVNVGENEEIDVIKGVSPENSEFLVVARLEILSKKVDTENEYIVLTVRRNKNLTIENYPDAARYKDVEE